MTCGKLFIETGTLNIHKILHNEEKDQNMQDMKLFVETGTSNKLEIFHDEVKAQNLQDMWEIIHGDWDLEQT